MVHSALWGKSVFDRVDHRPNPWVLPLIRIALAYAVLPNVLYLIAVRGLNGTATGIIGLEFLVAGAIAIGQSRFLGACLATIFFICDFMLIIAAMFYFTWTDVVSSMRSLKYVPPLRIAEWAVALNIGAIALAALVYVLTPRLPVQSKTIWAACLLALTLILGTGDYALFGHSRKDKKTADVYLTRSSMATLVLRAKWYAVLQHAPLDTRPTTSASAQMENLVSSALLHSRRVNVVMVLAESFGDPKDPSLLEPLEERYSSITLKQRYTVYKGSVPFAGATVDGEMRELCQNHFGLGVLRASASALEGCLPARFHRHGYRTVAVHGFVGGMFDRNSWYPKLGFDDSYFREDLRAMGVPDCPGAFVGSCDASVAEWIGNRLSLADVPMFVHWVTLNAHLPFPAQASLEDQTANCAKIPTIAKSDALCTWFKLQDRLHKSIAQLALRQDIGPTVFLIVGDHAPPFSSPSLRCLFSQETVPYLLLVPTTKQPLLRGNMALPNSLHTVED